MKRIPLRWWIGTALFLSTTINYIDRQTLSVLAPHIKTEFGWNNETFAILIIAFRVAYTIGQTACGRVLDLMGVRRGLSLTVAFYSAAAMLTSLATGIRSFSAFRFLLGAGESANWPGAAKTVSQYFPPRERGWAVALFDSGSAVGGAVAPFLAYSAYHWFGNWRPVFVLTGALGFLWILLFRRLTSGPQPTLPGAEDEGKPLPYGVLLRWRQTWGIIVSKSLTDPVWFFITDWFAIFLVSRGYDPEQTLIAFWVPFLAADIGNFAGGGLSSYLIHRGWPTLRSRRFVALLSGLGMTTLAGAAYAPNLAWLVFFFGFSTLAYASFSTIILTLPADLYPPPSVASVSGMSGTGAGAGTIAATYLTGLIADRYSFQPILLTASMVPVLATIAVLCLVPAKSTAAESPE
ncbi:MAG: Hexuronate transporter [Bryobacteraceae bacterium]|nr:Hexuronate transporter [Bryobacteraceae bacterium]